MILFYKIDDLQGKLTFLKENVEPWPTIIDYWTDTSKQRIAQLHVKSRFTNKENDKRKINKSKSNKVIPQIGLIQEKKELKNISSYLKKYPALKEKLGYTLVNVILILCTVLHFIMCYKLILF